MPRAKTAKRARARYAYTTSTGKRAFRHYPARAHARARRGGAVEQGAPTAHPLEFSGAYHPLDYGTGYADHMLSATAAGGGQPDWRNYAQVAGPWPYPHHHMQQHPAGFAPEQWAFPGDRAPSRAHPTARRHPVRDAGALTAGPNQECAGATLCTTTGYTCMPDVNNPPKKTCQARQKGAPCGARHAARCPSGLSCSSWWNGTCQ
jgi:hypothetical protein